VFDGEPPIGMPTSLTSANVYVTLTQWPRKPKQFVSRP